MRCYLCLGSNLGNTEENLARAIESICQHKDIEFIAKSSVYKTEPQGDKDQEWFANQVIAIDYACEENALPCCADMLMLYLLGVEAGMGRVRDEARRFAPRIIDIDIISMENHVIATDWVQVPHPRALERAFVLIPLQEIAPHSKVGQLEIEETLARLDYSLDNSGGENKIFQ